MATNTKKTISSDENKCCDGSSTRVHEAAKLLLLQRKLGILQTICPANPAKKTYCYKMTTYNSHSGGCPQIHFVKIFEDSTLSPVAFVTDLIRNKSLTNQLAPYILLPISEPHKSRLNGRTYDIVKYPFIAQCF
eukprot:359282_1